MSFAQLYREQYAEILRPAHKGEVHTVMITGFRNHEDKWSGNGWAIDFVDADGLVGSIACPFIRQTQEGTRPMAWLLPRQLETILKRIPDAAEFIVDPAAPFADTRIRPDAINLIRGAIVDVKCGYLGKDREHNGRTYQGRIEWDLVSFIRWHEGEPDAQEDADQHSPPRGDGGGGYGYAQMDEDIPFSP